MNVYYLGECRPLSMPLERFKAYEIRVGRGGDRWLDARWKAFRHALSEGESAAIVCGPCRLVENRQGQRPAHQYAQHGLLLYAEDLLRRHAGAVYLPHVHALGKVAPGWSDLLPARTSIAFYGARALPCLDTGDNSVGLQLVHEGFNVLTLQDYAYSGTTIIEDLGTRQQFKEEYDKARKYRL